MTKELICNQQPRQIEVQYGLYGLIGHAKDNSSGRKARVPNEKIHCVVHVSIELCESYGALTPIGSAKSAMFQVTDIEFLFACFGFVSRLGKRS